MEPGKYILGHLLVVQLCWARCSGPLTSPCLHFDKPGESYGSREQGPGSLGLFADVGGRQPHLEKTGEGSTRGSPPGQAPHMPGRLRPVRPEELPGLLLPWCRQSMSCERGPIRGGMGGWDLEVQTTRTPRVWGLPESWA